MNLSRNSLFSIIPVFLFSYLRKALEVATILALAELKVGRLLVIEQLHMQFLTKKPPINTDQVKVNI